MPFTHTYINWRKPLSPSWSWVRQPTLLDRSAFIYLIYLFFFWARWVSLLFDYLFQVPTINDVTLWVLSRAKCMNVALGEKKRKRKKVLRAYCNYPHNSPSSSASQANTLHSFWRRDGRAGPLLSWWKPFIYIYIYQLRIALI
jgi:hypothetical protein